MDGLVTASRAVVEGANLGPPGPLAEQARMADFYFPQRGILAVGRVCVTDRQLEELDHTVP